MGYSSYNDDFYRDRVADRVATGTPTFKHDADVRAGKVTAGVHDLLNIRGKIRESRDSKEHPNSNAIMVIFDETGSMSGVPAILQRELPKLMGLLLRKSYIEDPQILFGAVGDYPNREKAPLQIGQFESGIEMDDAVTHIYLEGNGGGTYEESYQNALYYAGHRTSCDCFEKRGKKGYLFLIGDEKAYGRSTKAELEDLMGVTVQGDVTLDEIMAAAKEKWEVFFIIPSGTNHYGDPQLLAFWRKHLGQNVIELKDPEAICETIGAAIGLYEGSTSGDTLASDLKDVGADARAVDAATTSTAAIAKDRALARVGTGTGGSLPVKVGRSKAIDRL
jgi:hypothetical protein